VAIWSTLHEFGYDVGIEEKSGHAITT
jgi:hypothetical protein